MVEQRGVFVTKPSEVRARAEAERKGVRVTVARGLPSGVLPRGVVGDGFVGRRVLPTAQVLEQERQNLISQNLEDLNKQTEVIIKGLNQSLQANIRGLSRNERLKAQRNLSQVLDDVKAERDKIQSDLRNKSLADIKKLGVLAISGPKFIQQFEKKGRESKEVREKRLLVTPSKDLTFLEKVEKRFILSKPSEEPEIKKLVEKGFDVAGEKLLGLSTEIVKKIPVLKALEAKAVASGLGVSEEEGKEITSDFLKFVVFGPLLKTGGFKKQSVQVQKQITETRFEQIKSLESSIEKELLRKKTIKDQLKFLKDLKTKHVKTAQQQKGFENLVKDLVNKNILKLDQLSRPAQRTLITGQIRIDLPPTLEKVPEILAVTQAGTREKLRVSQAQERNTLTSQIEKQKQKLRTLAFQRTKQKTIQKEQQKLVQLQKQKQGLATKQVLRYIQVQKQVAKQIQKQKLVQRAKAAFPKLVRVPKIPLVPPFLLRRRVKIKKRGIVPLRKEKGYHAFFKPIRRKKLVKITKIPVSKDRARDAMAWILDRTLSTTGKIKKTKLPPQKLALAIPKGYFRRTQLKFRDYKIVKGRKVPTPNKYIERRGKPRLDTSTERRKLTGLAELGRLKKRLTSSRLIKLKRRKR